LQLLIFGFLAGSLAGIGLGAARLLGYSTPGWLAIALLGGAPLLGGLIGLVWHRSWVSAARAVDEHYRLKDRSATALEFLAQPSRTDMQTLQISDAAEHLRNVDPHQVIPFRLPRLVPVALGVGIAALVVLFWPVQQATVEAGPAEPLPQILSEAEEIEQSLQDLEEEARREDNKDLEKLVEKLRQKVEEMKQPGVDEREALAKLSEMQAAIQSQQAEYNTALVDGELQSLGSAMSAATALEGAGRALQESKLEKAAQELEKIEDPQLDRKQQKAVDEKLKQVAKEMGDVGLGQLSGAVSDFAESLKGGKAKIKKATRVLAKEVRNQNRRKRVNTLLEAELARLNEGKCNCQSNSLVKGKKPEKSTSPSSTFGMTTSGNVKGEKTELGGQRRQEQLTGTPGEGPSDTETTASPEARQQAKRGYKDVYKKYRKMSDAVLDSEPIPLGHRQTIRRYFELIRPQNSDMPDKKDEGKAAKK
jgi:hypothetical protein